MEHRPRVVSRPELWLWKCSLQDTVRQSTACHSGCVANLPALHQCFSCPVPTEQLLKWLLLVSPLGHSLARAARREIPPWSPSHRWVLGFSKERNWGMCCLPDHLPALHSSSLYPWVVSFYICITQRLPVMNFVPILLLTAPYQPHFLQFLTLALHFPLLSSSA